MESTTKVGESKYVVISEEYKDQTTVNKIIIKLAMGTTQQYGEWMAEMTHTANTLSNMDGIPKEGTHIAH